MGAIPNCAPKIRINIGCAASGFSLWQLFGFVERYGASGTLKTRPEDQKTAGLQNFLQTLNERQRKGGELDYRLVFGGIVCGKVT